MEIVEKEIGGHEKVCYGQDAAANYCGIIAVHSTTLGPALGGTRLWRYADDTEALIDALRLARGMTYRGDFAGGSAAGRRQVDHHRPG